MAFLAGLRMRAVAVCSLVIAAWWAGLGWQFALKDYQKTRIYTFLDPEPRPRGAGYQKIQSQIAVGSGGLVGQGLQAGEPGQLGYLPARHTDFIFSVLAEEMGFLGRGASVLGALPARPLADARDGAARPRPRGRVPGRGASRPTFAFQVVYNVAMVAGLVPVKGLPLPLMSYGGSSVLSSLLAVGLILNVRMRRFAN